MQGHGFKAWIQLAGGAVGSAGAQVPTHRAPPLSGEAGGPRGRQDQLAWDSGLRRTALGLHPSCAADSGSQSRVSWGCGLEGPGRGGLGRVSRPLLSQPRRSGQLA